MPTFTKGLVAAANSLGRVSNAVGEAFKTGNWSNVFSTITDEVSRNVPGIIDTAVSVVSGFFTNAANIVSLAVSIVTGLATGIKDAMPELVKQLPTIAETLVDGFITVGETIGNAIIDAINTIFGTDLPDINLSGVKDVFQWFVDNKETIVGAVGGIIAAFATAKIIEFVSSISPLKLTFTLIAIAIGLVAKNWDKIKDWIGKTWETVVTWTQKKWDDVKGAIATVKDWVSDKAHNISIAISATVSNWIETIKGWIDTEKGKSFGEIALDIGAKVAEWIETIGGWIKNGLESLDLPFAATVGEWIERIFDWYSDGIKISASITATVSEWIQRIWDWVTNGVSVAVDFLGGLFSGGEPSGASWGEPDFEVPLDVPGWGGYAKGLNYVPFDGYALLHRGETVLNQSQGREWRQNEGQGVNSQALYEAVANAVSAAVSNIQINMDGRAVGNAVTQTVSRNINQAQFGRRYAPL